MPASQRAAPSEALINNTAIVTPDAQNIPHITTPSRVVPNWRKSNRTIEMINDDDHQPQQHQAAEAADILIQRHDAGVAASRR